MQIARRRQMTSPQTTGGEYFQTLQFKTEVVVDVNAIDQNCGYASNTAALQTLREGAMAEQPPKVDERRNTALYGAATETELWLAVERQAQCN